MNRILQQVAGILATADIEFDVAGNEKALFVELDSAVLQISGKIEDHPRVEIISWLLTDLDLDAATERAIRERLNELNAEWMYPRFCLVSDLDAITLEYEFPAGDLRPDDFRDVLEHLARLAEDLDDELQADFGGTRAMDFTAAELATIADQDDELESREEPEEASGRLRGIFGG